MLGSIFNKVTGLQLTNLFKKDSSASVFLWNLQNLSKQIFSRIPPGDCFCSWNCNIIVFVYSIRIIVPRFNTQSVKLMNFFQWNYVSMNENVKLKIHSKSEFWMQSLNRKFWIKHFEFWETHCTSGFNSTRIICCHSLSLDVPLAVTRCYSFSFSVTRCHSLSLIATFCSTGCHLMSLVVTLCITGCNL